MMSSPSELERRDRAEVVEDPSGTSRFDRGVAVMLFVASLLFLSSLTHDRVFLAGNDASRFAHIQALAEQGHSHVDGSRYAATPDRVLLDGRSYSNKPPFLGIVGAGVYRALRPLLGLDFVGHEARSIFVLTFLLVGVPAAALVTVFYLSLGVYPGISRATRLTITLAVAGGTILTSFAGTLNGHPPAAALLFGGFAAALVGRAALSGSLVALATCVDIVPGVLFVPALASIVADRSGRPGVARFLGAGALGAVLFVSANWWTLGSPLPPKLVPGAVDLSSRVAPSVGGVVLPASWTYPLECLFGWHGFFSVSPVLLFGVAGLASELRRPRLLSPRSGWLVAASLGAMILLHSLVAGSFGGWSYGFRYLIPIAPILLFFAPRLRPALLRWCFAPVLAVSFLLALLGAYHPWPPVDEQLPGAPRGMASLVDNPVGGNLVGWLEEVLPGSALTERLGERVISPDPIERRRYLALFYRSKGDLEMLTEIRQRPLPR